MAVQSYLQDRAGGMVAAGVFTSFDDAIAAIRALHEVGQRPQDISVVAEDRPKAKRLAVEAGAWSPPVGLLAFPRRFPKTVRSRYGPRLRDGAFVVITAADGQPAETLAAILANAKAADVQTWWQDPADLFPPPEDAGPL